MNHSRLESRRGRVDHRLLLSDDREKGFYVKTIHGKYLNNSKQVKVDGNNELIRSIVQSKNPVLFDHIPKNGNVTMLFQAPALCVPLLLHDKPLGILAVCGQPNGGSFGEEEMNLLQNLALQTAVAIENARLNENAEKTYFETISALALAVEAKDPYSRGHLDRVAKLGVKTAQVLNLSQEDINTLRDAAKLHDLGKIGIMDKILTKAGPLSENEMEMMRKHCEIGEGIIKPIRSLQNLCDIIRHHHERLDGTGYPDGLKGDEIKPLVRILAIADIYDALTSKRPYRETFTKEKAIEQLRSMKDQVDQKIVDIIAMVGD